MAISFTPDIINSGYNIQKINTNFTNISLALQDALSRSGTLPNQMETDLDLNGFSLLNVGTVYFTDFTGEGETFREMLDEVEANITITQDMVGNVVGYTDLAQKWSSNPEDVPVEAGGYSAYHWAQKALEWSTSGVAGVTSFNGRSGNVVPEANDYAYGDIDGLVTYVQSVKSSIEADVWKYRVGVGEVYLVDTSIAGVDIPPSSTTGAVFVQLTAGLTGSGQFNNGKLTSESVSGSAPDVLATAVVNLSGSPINGKTIRLLNTEGRIIRPYVTSGAVLGDAIRNITGSLVTRVPDSHINYPSGAFYGSSGLGPSTAVYSNMATGSGVTDTSRFGYGFNASRVVPTADENRMKMLGVTAYMRIK